MSFDFFALISRMKYIARWGLMRNSFPENIQEHSHMVAVIAHSLGVISREIYGKDCDPNACATVALYHDASEILTGDLPTPIKYSNSEIMAAYHDIEDTASSKLIHMLPEKMQASFESVMIGDVASNVYPLVKAADKLSAYIKMYRRKESWK